MFETSHDYIEQNIGFLKGCGKKKKKPYLRKTLMF